MSKLICWVWLGVLVEVRTVCHVFAADALPASQPTTQNALAIPVEEEPFDPSQHLIVDPWGLCEKTRLLRVCERKCHFEVIGRTH